MVIRTKLGATLATGALFVCACGGNGGGSAAESSPPVEAPSAAQAQASPAQGHSLTGSAWGTLLGPHFK